MKYITMAEKVEINGLKYVLSTNYGETYHETLGELKKCEAIRWYDMYLYRTQGAIAVRAMLMIRKTIGVFNHSNIF
jgi:hypothetical protein